MLTGTPLMIAFVASILLLLLLIIKFKINPFIAMLITSIVTGFVVQMPIGDISDTIATGFGSTLKGIGIVIGLGIIFGNILSEAGATESIARNLVKYTGPKRAPLAITTAGFLISIPVFMDAAFVIMMPILKYVAKETKKSMMVFICALGVGTIVGHAMVIPTPGPLAVADSMGANMGGFLLYSLIAGFVAIMAGGWLYGKRFDKDAPYVPEGEDAVELADRSDLPSFGLSMLTLLFPIVLILLGNLITALMPADSTFAMIMGFLGDKNIALLAGCIFAVVMLRRHIHRSFDDLVQEAASSAGLILLITGAGGAFGAVISKSGIGDYLVQTMTAMNIPPIVLAFALSALLRVSQGSTTVALVTTASILGPALAGTGASPVLVGLAICAGGIGFSLPNDSGFWILSRFGGLSVSDTLKSWTIGGTIASFAAFGVILILDLINSAVGLPLC